MQKVYGGEKPVPLWLEDSDDSSSSSTVKQILFTLVIRVKVSICFGKIIYNKKNIVTSWKLLSNAASIPAIQ